jgi:excisionase family DNA binding protein
MKRYTYEAIISPSAVGFEVYLPDFDQYTQGTDYTDAVNMAADLLDLLIMSALRDNERIPDPTFEHIVPSGASVIAISVMPDPEWDDGSVTTKDAAIMLGVSEARIRAMIHDGILASEKIGRDRLIPVWSVKARAQNPRNAGRPTKELLCH